MASRPFPFEVFVTWNVTAMTSPLGKTHALITSDKPLPKKYLAFTDDKNSTSFESDVVTNVRIV